MHCILQGVKIIDPASPHHQKVKDIRIADGRITEIGNDLTAAGEQIFDFKGKCISPGWMDMLCGFGDPGHEYKESLSSGLDAAAAGGFTGVCLLPNTEPTLHSKSEIEYILNQSKGNIVTVFPYGAVTKNRNGKDLTEMYDMHAAGAVAFTDADHAISDDGILLRSLQYVRSINGVIIDIPNNHSIVGNAGVNEGMMSVQLGMYGIPAVLEELQVIRDIKLAEYTQSKLHIGLISSAISLPHIREAKKKGIQVTAGVSAYQLFFDETELHDYNTHFKVNPPLRTKADRDTLIAAVADGTIDVICSNHLPHETDSKDVEFEYAAFGMESLEAVFGAIVSAASGQLSMEKIIETIAINPRKILGMEMPAIREQAVVDITVFDADIVWTFGKENIRSASFNSGFIGRTLKGKPVAILHKDQIKRF